MSECPYCEEFRSGIGPQLPSGDFADRVIAESEHFVAMADISPIMVGHLLVVPKRHVLCLARLDGHEVEDLGDLLHQLVATLGGLAPRATLEHGSDSSAEGGGCVSHAHLHLVPLLVDGPRMLSGFRTREVTSFAEFDEAVPADIPYLFVGNVNGRGLIATELVGLARQFIRIELARSTGVPGMAWDWRRHVRVSELEDTVARARESLSQ